MNPLRQSSLRRKLIAVIMLTVGPALVLAVAAFLTIEIYGYRTAAQRELQLLAKVVGESSSAALEFRDPAEGKRLLANLRPHRHLVSAALLDRTGKTFATYRRDGDGPVPEAEGRPAEGHAFEAGHLWLTTPVQHAGETLGTIYLRVDMAELNARLTLVLWGGMALTLLIGSAAMLLAMKMGQVASAPILHLTEAARSIATGRDANARVPRETEDEVGVLVDAFNHMLDQLQERQARLEEAQRLAHLGNWAYDPQQEYSEWSEETFRIFGLDSAQGVPDQERFRSLVHPDDLPAMDAALEEGMGPKGAFDLDHRILRPDGSIAWIHASGARFLLPSGRPVLRGTLMDITERKGAEAAMLQGQKLESLGILAGGIAHDFNNLLAALQGFLEVARLDMVPGSIPRKNLDKAERVVQRAGALVKQMLAYSGKASFHVAPLDLNAAVRELGHLLSASISKKARLSYDLAPDLPFMIADAAQIQQVVMNLVINASDAIGEGEGGIRLSTRLEWLDEALIAERFPGQGMLPGPFLALFVEDDGHGMDANTLARIFDPFFTTKFTGRGLGLAAMLGIVRGHKGGVKVTSQVGVGTAFHVYFPALPETCAVEESTPRSEPYRGSGTVLIIDDEPDIRASATAMLQWMGFEVLEAEDGVAGLEVVRAHPGELRLVLLDFTMPRMDGEACYHGIRDLEPALPILMTSGFSEGASAGRVLGAGLAGFLQKPYGLAELQSMLRRILP